MTADLEDARRVLLHYGIAGAEVSPVAIGLINRTFRVVRPRAPLSILQRVNPIFTPSVHEDIEAVTAHVASRGSVLMPRIIRTRGGALYAEDGGAIWRLMTFIEGETRERLSSAQEAKEAGSLLARFHRAVADLDHEFKNKRLGVHDTKRHLVVLREAIDAHRGKHPRFDVIEPLAREVLALAGGLPGLPVLPDRIVHGDPKISNLLFELKTGRGIGIVDLDTLAKMPLPLELGDAFRSWCNPSGEDHVRTEFSLVLFEGAVEGYAGAAAGTIERAECQAIVPATETIVVELAARFAADALNETYFGWDPSRFATRGEHNELRARGQVSLARSLIAQQDEARAIVVRACLASGAG